MVQRLSYGGRRRRRVALRQTHERQTGLGLPPDAMRAEERLLRAVDVPLAHTDPSELAEWPSHLAPQVRAQFLAGDQCLALRLVAGSTQPQDLRPVHAAAPVEAPDGVRLAPSLHGLGPFLGGVVLREPLQSAHQLAVDES